MEKPTIDLNAVVEIARQDNPKGFEAFYVLVHNRALPDHCRAWIEFIYAARENKRGAIIEAFRGSTKTTTVTNTFTAFRIGQEPQRANMLIQVSDDIAMDNSGQVADIIENSVAWKAVFPHVVPDRPKGWGAGGYEVKIDEQYMPYAEWRRMNSARKDPTLVGVGYKSREIIGKHPDGVLIVDDIHDQNNTASDRELSTVRTILTGTIFPTKTQDTWMIFIGTPWVENDCLSYAKSTGRLDHMSTPVYDAVDGELVYVWPEKFDEAEVDAQRDYAGEVEFARMFLLDLEAAKGVNLKGEWLHYYPAKEIGPSWPVIFGIDYMSTSDKLQNKTRDYFTLAILRAIPGGGLVLVDGYRAQISKGEALDAAMSHWAVYPTLIRMGVENLGKGEEYYNDLLLLRDLQGKIPPLMPIRHGHKSKGERFEKWLAPRFQAARIWVSDADTPFLREFRNEWLRWPIGTYDDCLDGVYMAAAAGEGFMPGRAERSADGSEKKVRDNALFALGRV